MLWGGNKDSFSFAKSYQACSDPAWDDRPCLASRTRCGRRSWLKAPAQTRPQTSITQQVNPFANYWWRGISRRDVFDLPQKLRAILGPFLKQSGFRRMPVSLRAPPLRPVRATKRQNDRAHNRKLNQSAATPEAVHKIRQP